MQKYTFEEIIEKEGQLVYSSVGTSMLPLIRQGRDLIVIEKPKGRLGKYDIPLYKRAGGQYVLHRVVKVLPEGYIVPEGRVKPWGTGHAVLCCRGIVDGPFAVINADDFYGRTAYEEMYAFLSTERPGTEHAMIAYQLRNTVTETGYVARGICQVENGLLTDVVERTHIEKHGEVISFTEDGENYTHLPADVPVSMNCWAFSNSMLDELYKRFPAWLDANLPVNPTKCEYFLPFVTNAMIKDGEGTVAVLPCHEQWYGMTYKEDFPTVVNAIKALRDEGVYPEKLLD